MAAKVGSSFYNDILLDHVFTRSRASWPSSSSSLAFSKDSKLEPIQRQTQNLNLRLRQKQILMLTLMLNMEVVPM